MSAVRGSGLDGLTLAVAILASASAGAEQGVRSLEGEELMLVNDLESGLGSLLGHWLGNGKNLEGALEKITVTADSGRRLVVRVTYSGFAGKKLWGELQDRTRRPQRQLRSEPVVLPESGGEVELTFELADPSEAASFESAYLALNVGEPNRSVPGLVKTYLLPKKWASSGEAGTEDEVMIDPVPVRDTPAASSIPGNPQPPPPNPPPPAPATSGGGVVGSETLLDEHQEADHVVETTAPIPNAFAGKPVLLRLTVVAGATSGKGWAAWIQPRTH